MTVPLEKSCTGAPGCFDNLRPQEEYRSKAQQQFLREKAAELAEEANYSSLDQHMMHEAARQRAREATYYTADEIYSTQETAFYFSIEQNYGL